MIFLVHLTHSLLLFHLFHPHNIQLTILVSRSHVFVLLNISNYFKKKQSEKVPLNHQILIWFSGLRGAVAFALGVTFLEHPHFDDTSKHMIFGTTVMVVVLTVFILGGLTPHMLILLKIAAPTDQKGGHDQEQGPATNGTANGHAVVNGNAATEGGKKGGANGYVELVEETGNEDDVVTSDETTSKTVFGFLINFDSR